MNQKLTTLIFIFISVFAAFCNRSTRETLTLTRSTFAGVDEMDTIEAYPEKGLYILQLVRYGAMDDFSLYLAFEKHNGKSSAENVRYEVNNKLDYQVSKDFVSFLDIKMGERNFGWFQMVNGKVVAALPGMNQIKDSIKRANKEVSIQENNGYITFYRNGTLLKKLNYGNLITKNQKMIFDSLDYNLYKVEGDSLILASKSGNDLFKQKDGVYFIPSPGYGVKSMFSKNEIFHLLDSVYELSSPPSKLQAKAIR